MKKTALKRIMNKGGQRRRVDRRFVIFSVFAFMMVATMSFLMTKNMQKTVATDFSGFKAGNIISDAVMRNYSSMTEADIQAFLDKHVSCNRSASGGWYVDAGTAYGVKYNYKASYGGTTYFYHVEDGKYVCMNSEKFNGETAAHIIYSLSREYKINPQVLLVLLEKEQGLVSDNWPNSNYQYRSATGFGCPDTAPCDSEYYGLRNQLESAAWLFDQVLSGGWTNYDVGNNWIRYSPNASCGGSWVNIENKATAALYRYTPYQPNAGAIANYPGGASCGAYGNRNFYAFFTDWFGSTQKVQYSFVQNYYNKNKSKTGEMVGDIVCKDKNNKVANADNDGYYNCYQDFEKGTLFWETETKGGVKTELNPDFFKKELSEGLKELSIEQRKDKAYQALVEKEKIVGKKVSDVKNFDEKEKIRYIEAENGIIIGSDEKGYFATKTKVLEKWKEEKDVLGFFTDDLGKSAVTGSEWQNFENGLITGNDEKGWFISMGETRKYWGLNGYNSGRLGFISSDIEEKDDIEYQKYEGGVVFGNKTIGYRDMKEGAFEKFIDNQELLGELTSDLQKSAVSKSEWYNFENGLITGNDEKGWFISMGKSREAWRRSGYNIGILGFLKSDIICSGTSTICWQDYENGLVTGNDEKGWFISIGKSRETWGRLGYSNSALGFPTSDVACSTKTNSCWQDYENGLITGNDEKGWFESRGSIRKQWMSAGSVLGKYGWIKSDIVDGCQEYEGGTICEE